MDPNRPPRNVKFVPKIPPVRPAAQPSVIDDEAMDVNEARDRDRLIRRINERGGRERPKTEQQPSGVAFEFGGSNELKTYGNASQGAQSSSAPEVVDNQDKDKVSESSRKPYREPWDHENTDYPITLPLRKPNSGDPELLDAEEFGDAAQEKVYDENSDNPAITLGFQEKSDEPRLIRFQFPHVLPRAVGGQTSNKGKEKAGSSGKACSLEDLPAGHIGKLLVYKSGAVKLKLGDFLYDVTSFGKGLVCPEDVMAVNNISRSCCKLGKVENLAVVVPDINSLLGCDP